VPIEAEALTQQVYSLLPRVKITELLIEVDGWIGFTKHFRHIKNNETANDKHLLLAAILADAINVKHIKNHWDETLRLAASIKQGAVTASLILRKLGSYPRQNGANNQ
jgi:hypothetical protein